MRDKEFNNLAAQILDSGKEAPLSGESESTKLHRSRHLQSDAAERCDIRERREKGEGVTATEGGDQTEEQSDAAEGRRWRRSERRDTRERREKGDGATATKGGDQTGTERQDRREEANGLKLHTRGIEEQSGERNRV
ncbi:UNVERIFIED_CONTAM: hypothetical protein K2H54_036085 [Gekko kuhli]